MNNLLNTKVETISKKYFWIYLDGFQTNKISPTIFVKKFQMESLSIQTSQTTSQKL